MAQAKSAQHFDTIVIGGDLQGLLAALTCAQQGQHCALFEAHDNLDFELDLTHLADTESNRLWLQRAQQALGSNCTFESAEAPPLTYESGRLQPFVGFGDEKVTALSEWQSFTTSHRLHLNPGPEIWVQRLVEQVQNHPRIQVFLQSHPTQLRTLDSQIYEAVINGARAYSAERFIYCASPLLLPSLLPESAVPLRFRQRLNKGHFFTAIYLDLEHAQPVTTTENLHILRGGQEDPCIGTFSKPHTTDAGVVRQHSQWMTLIPQEQTDDHELLSSALKRLKRQIKRPYPNALDALLREKIRVCPASHGDSGLEASGGGRWPKNLSFNASAAAEATAHESAPEAEA